MAVQLYIGWLPFLGIYNGDKIIRWYFVNPRRECGCHSRMYKVKNMEKYLNTQYESDANIHAKCLTCNEGF